MKVRKITLMLSVNSLEMGGAEQQLLTLVKGLDRKRFKPIVVTLFPGGELEQEIRNVPDTEYICLNRKGKYDFLTLLKICRLLRKKHVEIVQPFLTPATFFTLLPAIINRTPVKLVTERGNLRISAGQGYRLYLRTEDFLTRFADRIIPNSASGKEYVINRGINPSRVKVIYNGVNLQRLMSSPGEAVRIKDSLGLSAGTVTVGISARLVPLKDHATFLHAAQIVFRTLPHVKYIILGDGPLRQNLEEMTREMGIDSNVLFTGNQTEIGAYLSAFDIACLCSSEPEGCSNSILEAMALGKPVVATDVGGNVELVDNGKTGLVVPKQNPELLADALLTLLKDPELARKMGEKGKETVLSRFSIERMVRDYEALYEEVMKEKGKL